MPSQIGASQPDDRAAVTRIAAATVAVRQRSLRSDGGCRSSFDADAARLIVHRVADVVRSLAGEQFRSRAIVVLGEADAATCVRPERGYTVVPVLPFSKLQSLSFGGVLEARPVPEDNLVSPAIV